VKFKCCRTTLAAFAVTVMLAAQAFAAQANPAEVFGKLISEQEKQVVGLAEAMPADKYGFAPTNGQFTGVRTFAQQLTHVASAQYFFLGSFGVKAGIDPKSLAKLTSKDEIIKALKDSFAFARKATDTMTAQNAFEEIEERDGTNTRASIAALNLAHTNDHYGQMVEYLRMNGVVPPGSK
jgi:uncharacterized damage-inducible protein DinB